MMRGPCRTPPAANYLQRLLVPRMIEAILPRRCTDNARYSCASLAEASATWQAHRITSSARMRNVGGIVRPRACAVLRLITRSNLLDC
jgi:hypothetical protein